MLYTERCKLRFDLSKKEEIVAHPPTRAIPLSRLPIMRYFPLPPWSPLSGRLFRCVRRLPPRLSPPSDQRHSVIVASITPQARASLAERFGLSPAETHARLLAFLRERHGVHFLIDSSLGADFSLLEAGEEFVRRWRSRSSGISSSNSGPAGGSAAAWAAPPPTVALSSTRRFNVDLGREEDNQMQPQLQQESGSDGVEGGGGGGSGLVSGKRGREGPGSAAVANGTNGGGGGGDAMRVGGKQDGRSAARGPGELLVLTSACPGWVCYAEKTAPEALPFMSTVKSPQQVSLLT